MRITAIDIDNKEFKKTIRGYSTEEVDEFLEVVAEDYEKLYKEHSIYKEKISVYEEKIDHYKKIEETIQNTLLLAQNASEEVKKSAQKESDLILKNANDSAKRILDKANNDVLKINDEYERVKAEFNKFRTKFRNFMNSQVEMFQSLEREYDKTYNIGKIVNSLTVENEAAATMEQNTYDRADTLDKTTEFNLAEFQDKVVDNEELENIKTFFANK